MKEHTKFSTDFETALQNMEPLFFVFSMHADFKIVRQHVSMHSELQKNNFNDCSLPQKCSVWGFHSAGHLNAIRHHGQANCHTTTAAARET